VQATRDALVQKLESQFSVVRGLEQQVDNHNHRALLAEQAAMACQDYEVGRVLQRGG
jgi:hypothetical protein